MIFLQFVPIVALESWCKVWCRLSKKKIFFFLFTSFADKLLGICKLPKISEKLAVITFELIISLINSNQTGASEDSFFWVEGQFDPLI